MKRVGLILSLFLISFASYAGRIVKHQHKCPGIFRGMDICLNYVMADNVTIGDSLPFIVEFYTWESSQAGQGNRVFVDIEAEGDLAAELMMAHSSGEHMSMPVQLQKLETGRYLVNGATVVMHGQWGLTIDLIRPGYLIKRSNLYFYVYPDNK